MTSPTIFPTRKIRLNLSAIIITAFLVLIGNVAFSQDLIYRPINPAFGGDTFNYQWLLSSAQAQNKLEDSSNRLLASNPLNDFEANLNRQLLSELSRKLVGQIFGEETLQEGAFQIGTFQVNIQSGLDGIGISILGADGNKTEIKVPYY
jgi:curli production assembly/transport component CsgF